MSEPTGENFGYAIPDRNFSDRSAALLHGAIGTGKRLQTFLTKIDNPNAHVIPYHGFIDSSYTETTQNYPISVDWSRYMHLGSHYWDTRGGGLVLPRDVPGDRQYQPPYESNLVTRKDFFSGYFAYVTNDDNQYSVIFIGYTRPNNSQTSYVGVRSFIDQQTTMIPFSPDLTPNKNYERWASITDLLIDGKVASKSPDEMKNLWEDSNVTSGVRRNMEAVLSTIEAKSDKNA